MYKSFALLCTVSLGLAFSEKGFSEIAELQQAKAESNVQTPQTKVAAPFHPFTGKIVKNKVRMRASPGLEGAIVKELSRGDLFLVVGESDDFYAVAPPEGTKAYIFRTFVLDGIVEGSHVNVRLQPSIEAPAIAQLNSGDRVDGKISPTNSKWLEIAPPPAARLFIAKEYIQNIGNPDLIATLKKRHSEVAKLLSTAQELSEREFHKSFEDMDLAVVYKSLNKAIQEYGDFPEEMAQAKQLLANTEAAYLQKKIAYLESKPKVVEQPTAVIVVEEKPKTEEPVALIETPVITTKMAAWYPAEEALYNEWVSSREDGEYSKEEFYQEQRENAVTLKGMIDNYLRPVKNRPGDFVLINGHNNLPLAFLYSTDINLQDYVGREVTLSVVERPNDFGVRQKTQNRDIWDDKLLA
jgi:hypothetical protein